MFNYVRLHPTELTPSPPLMLSDSHGSGLLAVSRILCDSAEMYLNAAFKHIVEMINVEFVSNNF